MSAISIKYNSYSFLVMIPFDSNVLALFVLRINLRSFFKGNFPLSSQDFRLSPAKSRGLGEETSHWEMRAKVQRTEEGTFSGV